jgi:endoglucanase
MLLTRRSFNTLATIGLASGWPAASVGQDASPGATSPFVHEVTIATPDVIAVEVRDPAYVRGRLVALGRSFDEKLGAWIQVEGQWGLLVGRDRDHVRLQDRPPPVYLDRRRIDAASGYTVIGAGPVTAVYRKSVPYDTGFHRGEGGETIRGASFKHFVYLKLAKPLMPGSSCTIRWPGQMLPDTEFRFEPRNTRAIAIRANQHGYRSDDAGKVAYLSLWMPGAPGEGAVDFSAYGLKEFTILRADGEEVFRGPIQVRKGPGDPEPGNGFPTQVLEYPSSAAAPLRVVASERGAEVALQAPGHAMKAGQRIWLSRFGGTFSGLNGFQTVQSVTSDQIRIKPARPVQLPAVTTAAGIALPVYRANTTGTFVYELTFDAWRASEGEYRIHVPGLGVSDAFRVDDTVWLDAARTSIEGLYNHRSGIALDGRFGYSRPASYRPGQTIEVRRSKLPLSFASDYVGFIDYVKGAAAPWLSDASNTQGYWGGYMDAGDWDRRIQHLNISYMFLDLFEMLPEAGRSARLGVPKSSEYLDEALYAGEDALPDLIHEAIWSIDFFRRLQLASGDVQGGIESGGGLQHGEPSFLEHHTVFVFAPDHISSFRYAMAAGKLARILGRLGRSRLAGVYADSALAAWKAGERGFADPDAYYADAIAIARASGDWDPAAWDQRKAAIQKEARDFRMVAAAVLLRLTGDPTYRSAFEEIWNAGGLDLTYQVADGAWEYVSCEKPVNEAIRDNARGVLARASRFVMDGQAGAAYPSLKHFYAPFGWGQGSAPDYNVTMAMIRGHRLTGNPALIRALQVGSSHILGANQAGLSFTLGLGHRNVRHPLHEDHLAMGVDAPRGITIYGWSTKEQVDFDWLFGAFWTSLPETTDTRERADQRQLHPNRWTLPIHEFLIEHPLLVAQQEYTVHQTIATTAVVWLYLNAVDR